MRFFVYVDQDLIEKMRKRSFDVRKFIDNIEAYFSKKWKYNDDWVTRKIKMSSRAEYIDGVVLIRSIDHAFKWDTTLEGHQYWSAASEKVDPPNRGDAYYERGDNIEERFKYVMLYDQSIHDYYASEPSTSEPKLERTTDKHPDMYKYMEGKSIDPPKLRPVPRGEKIKLLL